MAGIRPRLSSWRLNGNSNEAGTDMGYGAGWRTSLSQTVEPRTIDGIQYYAYTDEDGTIHYFPYDSV